LSAVFEPWESELIDASRYGILGTVGVDGAPHLVPVCYAFVDGVFAIAIDEKPKLGARLARLRNIEREPRATLLIERYDDDWAQLAWLRVDCSASVVERGLERPDVLAALRARYAQYREMRLEGSALILLEPLRAVSWRWSATRR
jgi:PPOX class probable F420-dependent enzyme